MAPNPISEAEFAAFCRRRQVTPTIWEGDILLRLDDAFLAALQEKAGGETQEPSDPSAVSLKDRAGVRRVLSGIGERLRARGVKTD